MKPETIFELGQEYYNNSDLTALLNLFSKDIIVWGHSITNVIKGLDNIEKIMNKIWDRSIKSEIYIKSFVPKKTNSDWFALICKVIVTEQNKSKVFDNLRVTIILKKEDGQNKISHIHASFPDFRTEKGSCHPSWEIF